MKTPTPTGAGEFADSLPLRAVVERVPSNTLWHDERLDCGHVLIYQKGRARRRRCPICGPKTAERPPDH